MALGKRYGLVVPPTSSPLPARPGEPSPRSEAEAPQSTVARPIEAEGLGLHTGRRSRIALTSAPPGTGIVFRVSGAATASASSSPISIPARVEHVVSAQRATVLGNGSGVRVSTVEHLLSVFYVLGLDNVRVEITGGEVPVFDGSAAYLLDWVRSAGAVPQTAPREILSVAAPLRIEDGDRWISAEPADGLFIDYAIDFSPNWIGTQRVVLPEMNAQVFERELAAARTFGFEAEVEALRASGLGQGGSLESVLVVTETGVLNPDGLRWPDEFVRHKVIDLLGDLALLGTAIRGHIRAERAGHALHHELVRALRAA